MNYNSVWKVEGKRIAAGGIEHSILATAFGPEEENAWRWFDKHINGDRGTQLWKREHLTFTREASWTH